MTRNIADHIQRRRADLENPYAYLNGEGEYEAVVREMAVSTALIDMARVLNGRRKGRPFARPEIARFVRNLHIEMWRRRAEIFPSVDEVDPLQILDPERALRSLGYNVVIRESLGQHSGHPTRGVRPRRDQLTLSLRILNASASRG